MPRGTAPAKSPGSGFVATGAAVKRGLHSAGPLVALVAALILAGCSITVGPQPTPGATTPGQPTMTPIDVVRVDITRVPSPTTGPPTPTRGPAGEPMEYTIKSGDTLSGIATEFGVTVDQIVRFNNITDPNSIYEGQVILIPPPDANLPPAGQTPGGETPIPGIAPTATMVP